MKLSKNERETSIIWNQTDEPVQIWTYDTKLKKRLRNFANEHPDLCHIDSDEHGLLTATVEKSRVSMHLNPPQSEERRKKASARAKAASALHTKKP